MNARDAIAGVYTLADLVLNSYLSDLDDADLLVRPGPGQNHIAWQLGHLIVSERALADSVRPGTSPALPEGFEAAHGREESVRASDDPKRFLTKDAYLALYKTQRAATLGLLNSLSDSDLDAPSSNERMRERFPTVGSIMTLVGTHVIMHAGQFVTVRRKQGKGVVI